MTPENPDIADSPPALEALIAPRRKNQTGGGYTRFIRAMRVILLLGAVIMAVIAFTWQDAGQRIKPIPKEEITLQPATVQNELVKPVFNSVDDKNQPFTVLADRAVQDKATPDLITLERPAAELKLQNGDVINAMAQSGLYEQKAQKLSLSGGVELRHSLGYILSSEEMRVDLITRSAFSGRDVTITGEKGRLEAKGLEGSADAQHLVFVGPARLVLSQTPLTQHPAGTP